MRASDTELQPLETAALSTAGVVLECREHTGRPEELQLLSSGYQRQNGCFEATTAAGPPVPPAPRRRDQAAAPDGGWGWVIVACSLIISLVQDGVSFSFGLIYVELLREFHASKSHTSWVGALFLAVPLLAGPLASVLVERYGCRAMTILGGLLSAAGFVASAVFGHSIDTLLLTFGVISGLGLALGYVTAVVSIAFWFDKRRSLANGLGVCGTGIGTFVLAPLTQVAIAEYGWRGTTLLLAGAFLQMCVCGAAMREPDWVRQARHERGKRDGTDREEEVVIEPLSTPQLQRNGAALQRVTVRRSLSPLAMPSDQQLGQHRHSLTYRGAMVRVATPWSLPEERAASCPELRLPVIVQQPNTAAPTRTERLGSMLRGLLKSLDQALFCEPAFLLLCAGTLLLFTWFIVPYFYVAEHMLRHGYTDADASHLIAIIGVPNTIAMVALGWAGDKPWLPVAKTYGVCQVICGLATLAMPLLIHSYLGLASAAAMFGLSFASNFSFTPVLLVQLVELDRFSAAFGLVLLVQGAGNLLGPPLAGWLFDLTGTWDLSFYLAGVFIIVAGLLTLLIPLYAEKPATSRSPPRVL